MIILDDVTRQCWSNRWSKNHCDTHCSHRHTTFSGGKMVTITLDPNGINIPAPIACKTRPPIIIGKLVEIPQTNEPIVIKALLKIAYDMNIY